jgi:16S rRNA C967 or C1407 C5-methylase (RsmB/RsmF family)
LCAAPGGKTTHIAACLKNQGEIIANDISQQRVYKLANVLKQYAVTCARTSRMPGHLIWQRYTDYFDGVLVDAPCSMRGTAEHSPSEVKSLAKQQKFLLKSALSAAKPGGVIVYSTCTTTVEENENVIAWLLEKHPGQVSVEPLELPNVPLAPALPADAKGHPFPESIALTRRILPSEELEGFFVAKLRKNN